MRHMVLAALLLVGCATGFGVEPTGPWTDFYNEPRSEDVPKDVRVFVIKSQGCGHFSGEVGDDNDSEHGRYLAVAKIIQETWDAYGFE